ncbi:hypothetical protein NLI96_g1409 [Meripilus lineatus]|uniref:Uncharacterized protein n=1 Tax=Meripilus lineatus TaxID=2056292 RepID=A0AAD5VAY3_9APHY|nr:hypothetical protein NLI96_g1409 [Physisporinus lineatus]
MEPAADGVHTVTTFIPRQVSNPQLRGYAIPFVPTPAPQAAPPVNVDSPRLSANATVFIPGSSSVVLNPPQGSVSSADSTLEFDDLTEAISRHESNYELS